MILREPRGPMCGRNWSASVLSHRRRDHHFIRRDCDELLGRLARVARPVVLLVIERHVLLARYGTPAMVVETGDLCE